MKGIKTAIRYGYIPHNLGLCGPQDAAGRKAVKDFVESGWQDCDMKSILKDFKGAYPYYQLIASSNNIANPLDESVVEAYWLGNSLLDKVSVADYKSMIKKEFLPLGKIKPELVINLPDKAIPFHNFHVLYIGSVSGKINFTPKAMNLCMVSWANVKKISGANLLVSGRAINFEKNLKLTKNANRLVTYDVNLLPKVRVGDLISIHWDHAIAKLSDRQIENIKKYTKKTLDIFK